jgi:hypothetical protein
LYPRAASGAAISWPRQVSGRIARVYTCESVFCIKTTATPCASPSAPPGISLRAGLESGSYRWCAAPPRAHTASASSTLSRHTPHIHTTARLLPPRSSTALHAHAALAAISDTHCTQHTTHLHTHTHTRLLFLTSLPRRPLRLHRRRALDRLLRRDRHPPEVGAAPRLRNRPTNRGA